MTEKKHLGISPPSSKDEKGICLLEDRLHHANCSLLELAEEIEKNCKDVHRLRFYPQLAKKARVSAGEKL